MARRSTSLPASPESPAAARGFVRGAIADTGLDIDVDDALLAVSEVVSNVVRHAGTPMRLDVAARAGLRVAVTDRRPDLGLPSEYQDEPMATRGRGLHLLDAVASRWGETRSAGTKTVWFEIDATAPVESRDACGPGPEPGARSAR
jgi:anti-sigma regulatory factor (Ser/Thr protein kinase)